MAKYRKKLVFIEAVQFSGAVSADLAAHMQGCRSQWGMKGNGQLAIQTLEGVMCADVGDWIIRGVQGEYYPCKPQQLTDALIAAINLAEGK